MSASAALGTPSSGVRFQTLLKVATYAVATTGLAALTLSGELGGVIPIVLGLAVFASWFAEGDLLHRPGWNRAWNVAAVLFFVASVVRGVLAGTVLTPAVELASFLQVNRLFNRRTGRDYLLIDVLAFAHLVGATVLDNDLSYAACFAAFVVFAPWAMVLTHLRREIEHNYLVSDPAGAVASMAEVARILRSRRIVAPRFLAGVAALSVPTFLMTATLFVLFPRLGFGLLVSSPRYGSPVIGFSDRIELGDIGTLRDDPAVVLRLEPRPMPLDPPRIWPVYLRGTAFDRYDGRVWHRTAQPAHRIYGEAESGWRTGKAPSAEYRLRGEFRQAGEPRIRVWMDAIDPPVVFVTPDTLSVSVPPRLEAGVPQYRRLSRGAEDEIRHVDTDDLGLDYVLNLDRAPRRMRRPPEPPDDVSRYLEIPALPERVIALADRWVAGSTDPLEKARRIAARLRTEYRYTRDLAGDHGDPLEDFLLRRKAGHCEYFSTALAILLRAQGVPTRNVSGFYGGTWNAYGQYYAVRQSNAHSWVEAWLPGRGWTTLDPTPAAPPTDPADDAWAALLDVGDALRLRWQRWVVSYDLGRQIALFQRARRWLGDGSTSARGVRDSREHAPWPRWVVLLGVAALVGGAALVLRRRQKLVALVRPPGAARPEVRLYAALERKLARRGRARPASRTPADHVRALERDAAPEAALAKNVTDVYLRARFAAEPIDAAKLDALKREIAQA